MITLDKAVQIILEGVVPLGLEKIPTAESYGRILGESIVSKQNIPKYNLAAIDGYALSASDTLQVLRSKPAKMTIVGESKPGRIFKGKTKKGNVVKVSAGVRVPDGFDAVVKFEDVARTEGAKLNVYVKVRAWQNIVRVGKEVSVGDSLMPAGRVLNAADMARLVEIGMDDVNVYKKPKIGLISLGDEFLSDSEDDRNPGISRNQFLNSLINQSGAEFIYMGPSPFSTERLDEILKSCKSCDQIIIMAGRSIENYNFLKKCFRELNIELKFWRVAIKPGKSVLFGYYEGIPIFGVSGNLWSVAVLFDQLVKPLISRQSGLKDIKKLEVIARITKELRVNPSMTQFFKAVVKVEQDGFTVSPILERSAGELWALSIANGLIIIPPETHSIQAGNKVRVEILGPLAVSAPYEESIYSSENYNSSKRVHRGVADPQRININRKD